MVAPAIASKVGVELFVGGLSSFKSKMGQAASILGMLKPKATLIEGAFKGLGNTISGFASGAVRTLQYALGDLISSAIQGVITQLKEMGTAIIESGDEFQRLNIRLNRFNLNNLTDSGMDYNAAITESIKLTKDQIMWTMNLGGLTPYASSDIANVFSLARSYGFVADEAQELTESILDFSAGMGLGNDQIERIVVNFGQMMQQGKITGTELRDLGRGSLVPVNRVLARVAENLGITKDGLNDLRKAGETDPKWFVEAFNQIVAEDFEGASKNMLKVMTASIQNIKDLVVDGLSAFTTLPVFETIAGKFNSIADGFYEIIGGKETLRKDFIANLEKLGESISRIVEKILELGGGGQGIADTIIAGLGSLADWVEANEDNIVAFIEGLVADLKWLGQTIRDVVVPWIQDKLIPTLERFGKWFKENEDVIMPIIIAIVLAFLAWELSMIAWRIAITVAIHVVLGALTFAASVILFLWTVIQVATLTFVLYVEGKLLDLANFVKSLFTSGDWETSGEGAIHGLQRGLDSAAPSLYDSVYDIGDNTLGTWNGFWGMDSPSKVMENSGVNLMQGVINGLASSAQSVYNTIINIANEAIRLWNSIFDTHSPSKVMETSGENIMDGLSRGLQEGGKRAIKISKDTAETIKNTLGAGGGAGTNPFGNATAGSNTFLGPEGDLMRETKKMVKSPAECPPCPDNAIAERISSGVSSGMSSAVASIGKVSSASISSIEAGVASIEGISELSRTSIEKHHTRNMKGITKVAEDASFNIMRMSRDNHEKILTYNVGALGEVKTLGKNATGAMSRISRDAHEKILLNSRTSIGEVVRVGDAAILGIADISKSSRVALETARGQTPGTQMQTSPTTVFVSPVANKVIPPSNNNVTINNKYPTQKILFDDEQGLYAIS